MTAELIDLNDLSIMLSMGKRSAREFCMKNGVMPINVGRGKIARLRWRVSEVMQMLGTLEASRKPAHKDIIPRRRGCKTVVGKSVDQLMRELALLQ